MTRGGLIAQFPILGRRPDQPAGQLSGGEQQILAIARGLLAKPTLLLLDEPSLGLAPQMVDAVFDAIQKIHNDGVTILLSGTGAALRRNPEVQKAYLGG